MTIREFVGVVDEGLSIVVEKGGETVAAFDTKYVDSIIDDILDTEIGHIAIDAAYRGSTTVTITDEETDEEQPDDGDDGGDTEPDDENP